MNSQLVKMMKDQAKKEYQAHSLLLGLSLWAKTQGWLKTHKWIGALSKDERKHTKGIQKYLADYAEVEISMPATDECSCMANGLLECYMQAREAVKEAQAGWEAISAKAQELEECALDAFADTYMYDNVKMLKNLNRKINILKTIGPDVAAQMAFDKRLK